MLFNPNIKIIKDMVKMGKIEFYVNSTPSIDKHFEEIENIFVDVDIPISLVVDKGIIWK